MKRTFAFMMALVLVFSLAATAFAAGTGSITVNNTLNGVNYKLFKIFDATYKADSNPDNDGDGTMDIVAYTLSTSSPVYTKMFNGVTESDGKLDNGYFVYEVATGVVTKNTGKTDDQIITYLTNMIREMYDVNEAPAGDACFVANQTASGQTVKFTDLDYGYYLIDTENAEDAGEDKAKIAVTITTNTPDVNVIEKNKAPGDLDKEADDKSVNIGDTIEWEISFLATNYDGSDKVVEYTITDTLSSAWAEYNFNADNTANITVKVGEQTLTAGTDYTLKMTNTDGKPGFVVTIPWANVDGEGNVTSFKYDALETVTITYSGTVLEAAANKTDLKNTADLDWEFENGTPGVGDGDEEETKTYNIGFTKVDGTTSEGLAGAEFELYKMVDGNKVNVEVTAVFDTEGNPTGVYNVDPDGGSNLVVSPADGKVVILGLAEGTYYLKETKAPDGYNKLADPVEMVIVPDVVDVNGNVTEQKGSELIIDGTTYYVNHAAKNIANNQGVELPSTGGAGTVMMITFGTMVALAFAVLMITQKKMSIYQD